MSTARSLKKHLQKGLKALPQRMWPLHCVRQWELPSGVLRPGKESTWHGFGGNAGIDECSNMNVWDGRGRRGKDGGREGLD